MQPPESPPHLCTTKPTGCREPSDGRPISRRSTALGVSTEPQLVWGRDRVSECGHKKRSATEPRPHRLVRWPQGTPAWQLRGKLLKTSEEQTRGAQRGLKDALCMSSFEKRPGCPLRGAPGLLRRARRTFWPAGGGPWPVQAGTYVQVNGKNALAKVNKAPFSRRLPRPATPSATMSRARTPSCPVQRGGQCWRVRSTPVRCAPPIRFQGR